jgi:hypothetical protein
MAWEKLAEERIQQAIQEGEFDDLPGKGRPIDLSEYFKTPVADRMAYSILKNAGVVPPEVEWLKEVGTLEQRLEQCPAPTERSELNRELQARRVNLALVLERRRVARRADAALDLPLT